LIYDLIIIGGGPAGITAGIYAAIKKMSVLLVEKYFEVGGQLIKNSLIDNYPGFPGISGFDLSQNLKNHLAKTGVTIKEEEVIELKKNGDAFKIVTAENIYKSRSVIIATGMETKKSGAIDEEKFAGRGVSYCATCDASLYKDKIVGVYGSGPEAESTIIELLPYAKTIYFITDKKHDDYYLGEVKNNVESGNVIIKNNSTIKRFKGKENLEKVTIKTGKGIEDLEIEGFFVNLGYAPVTDFAKDFLKTNNKKEIIVDSMNQTNIEGVFAAGDCTSYPYKQVVTASAQGAAAALSSFRYLHGI
jgi:thioredoxin reductase (NADPH)